LVFDRILIAGYQWVTQSGGAVFTRFAGAVNAVLA
jgi:hypothetical protein